MKAETEEFLRSSMNHENGDGSTSGCLTEGTDFSFFSIASSASVELAMQTLRPVLTEAQAETEG